MRLMRYGAWFVLAVHIVCAVVGYGALPEEIPRHIAFDGTPGNYAPRSLGAWFLLPAIAVAMQLLLEAIARVLPGRPQLFNFPEKARFLDLPAAHRAPVITEMVGVLDLAAFGVQAILLLVLGMLWDAATGASSTAGSVMLLNAGVALTPALLLRIRRVSLAVAREELRLAGAARR
jgi:hypothetical protein